jgi:glycosyltransferase involved in cell wall biosynthesis
MQESIAPKRSAPTRPMECGVAVLTGGFDKPYTLGLTMALASKGLRIEVIGSDDVDSPEMHTHPNVTFFNLRGSKRKAGLAARMSRGLIYYTKLFRYAATAKPKIFHILWNNKFQHFDRTLLMLYYKVLGKKIVFTAHNVNAGVRDSNDSFLNRLTLRIQYHLADHIFVHTQKMRDELLRDFGVSAQTVSVIPFGINNSVPDTDLTAAEAKQRLGIAQTEKAILFFGAIRPYKGLEYLVDAFFQLAAAHPEYRLIIAGSPREDTEQYLRGIQRTIEGHPLRAQVIQRIQFIPDEETELYFKASDVLALPYTHVFQSGVLFLAYGFGLPAIAADVASFREDVIEGRSGFLFDPALKGSLAEAIERYFASDLYAELPERRRDIRQDAARSHSWECIGQTVVSVYERLFGRSRGGIVA